MKPMLAVFHTIEDRDRAVSDAKSENMQILYIGDVKPVLRGDPVDGSPDPFVLFSAHDATDVIFFMQHGAGSCSNLL